MLVTKHAAELCALLVNDLYGELPSRILIALLTKGRSTVAQLIQYTSLTPRHLRSGLGVLIQQNLLYHHTDPDTKVTKYEANADACYSLSRFGKILDFIENQYGTSERDLVQTLMLLGHARIADLAQAFSSRTPKVNGHTNGDTHNSQNGLIESESQLNSVLARLIQAEILETVRTDSFRNPSDVFHEIEEDITKPAPGERATKTKTDQQRQIIERCRMFRDQGKALKRSLDQSEGHVSKKRKLANGAVENGHAYEYDPPPLNPNIVVRLNHEKCLVELRNLRLVSFAADTLGEVTAEIYRTVLELLTAEFPRCRPNSLLDDETPGHQVAVTTMDIYEHLDETLNVQSGIGKAPADRIDRQSAEKVRTAPPDPDYDSDDSAAGPSNAQPRAIQVDFDELDESDDEKSHPNGGANGNRETKVTFDDGGEPQQSRLTQMRQHLLLLAESKYAFLRHCGTQGRGQWTVDFSHLLSQLRESELDAIIAQSHGRHGLRLTKILREKGKLDEKMLYSTSLMKKSDVQGKMLAMQMAGIVDVQEVPKDGSRVANRTLFFWYFDRERAESQTLDDIYKAMVRCLQTLHVERHKERNILTFVERKDVQGKEEEVMTAEHYNKYNRHLEIQDKLLGQVMRLDELVAILRDY